MSVPSELKSTVNINAKIGEASTCSIIETENHVFD